MNKEEKKKSGGSSANPEMKDEVTSSTINKIKQAKNDLDTEIEKVMIELRPKITSNKELEMQIDGKTGNVHKGNLNLGKTVELITDYSTLCKEIDEVVQLRFYINSLNKTKSERDKSLDKIKNLVGNTQNNVEFKNLSMRDGIRLKDLEIAESRTNVEELDKSFEHQAKEITNEISEFEAKVKLINQKNNSINEKITKAILEANDVNVTLINVEQLLKITNEEVSNAIEQAGDFQNQLIDVDNGEKVENNTLNEKLMSLMERDKKNEGNLNDLKSQDSKDSLKCVMLDSVVTNLENKVNEEKPIIAKMETVLEETQSKYALLGDNGIKEFDALSNIVLDLESQVLDQKSTMEESTLNLKMHHEENEKQMQETVSLESKIEAENNNIKINLNTNLEQLTARIANSSKITEIKIKLNLLNKQLEEMQKKSIKIFDAFKKEILKIEDTNNSYKNLSERSLQSIVEEYEGSKQVILSESKETEWSILEQIDKLKQSIVTQKEECKAVETQLYSAKLSLTGVMNECDILKERNFGLEKEIREQKINDAKSARKLTSPKPTHQFDSDTSFSSICAPSLFDIMKKKGLVKKNQ